MRPEPRATAQCLLPARNVVDEKTMGLKIITQHGAESRLVFDLQDPRPVGVRYAEIPSCGGADTSNKGDGEASFSTGLSGTLLLRITLD